MRIAISHVICVAVVLCLSLQYSQAAFQRFCYVSSWARYRKAPATFNPENIGAHLCSHLCFAFVTLDSTGTYLKAADPADDPQMFKRFLAMKTYAPETKMLVSVGGWNMGSDLFKILVASDSNIHTFAFNAIYFLRSRGFDGLDIAWDYPADRGSPPSDKMHFTKLIQYLRQAFEQESVRTGKPRLLLTAALGPSPGRVSQSYEPVKLALSLDLINLQTYDLLDAVNAQHVTGHHSALNGTDSWNIDFLAEYWAHIGVPKAKILIGLPFFAKTFSLDSSAMTGVGSPAHGGGRMGDFTVERGTLAYYEVCKILQDGASGILIPDQKVPYLVDGDRWVGYDDEKSLKAKVDYVVHNHFGGVMVWALDMDDFSGICGKAFPLMNAINQAFQPFGRRSLE